MFLRIAYPIRRRALIGFLKELESHKCYNRIEFSISLFRKGKEGRVAADQSPTVVWTVQGPRNASMFSPGRIKPFFRRILHWQLSPGVHCPSSVTYAVSTFALVALRKHDCRPGVVRSLSYRLEFSIFFLPVYKILVRQQMWNLDQLASAMMAFLTYSFFFLYFPEHSPSFRW